jgi:hypothetical protein
MTMTHDTIGESVSAVTSTADKTKFQSIQHYKKKAIH